MVSNAVSGILVLPSNLPLPPGHGMTRETRETRQNSRQVPRDNGSHLRETLLASDIEGLPRASSHQGISTYQFSPLLSCGHPHSKLRSVACLAPTYGHSHACARCPMAPVAARQPSWPLLGRLDATPVHLPVEPRPVEATREAAGFGCHCACRPMASIHVTNCRPKLAIRVSLGIRCMRAGIQTFLHAWITCRSASRAIVPIKGVRWRLVGFL